MSGGRPRPQRGMERRGEWRVAALAAAAAGGWGHTRRPPTRRRPRSGRPRRRQGSGGNLGLRWWLAAAGRAGVPGTPGPPGGVRLDEGRGGRGRSGGAGRARAGVARTVGPRCPQLGDAARPLGRGSRGGLYSLSKSPLSVCSPSPFSNHMPSSAFKRSSGGGSFTPPRPPFDFLNRVFTFVFFTWDLFGSLVPFLKF